MQLLSKCFARKATYCSGDERIRAASGASPASRGAPHHAVRMEAGVHGQQTVLEALRRERRKMVHVAAEGLPARIRSEGEIQAIDHQTVTLAFLDGHGVLGPQDPFIHARHVLFLFQEQQAVEHVMHRFERDQLDGLGCRWTIKFVYLYWHLKLHALNAIMHISA
jgi:hypothetical protein